MMRLEWERTDGWFNDQDFFKAGMMIVRLRKVCISEGSRSRGRSENAGWSLGDDLADF